MRKVLKSTSWADFEKTVRALFLLKGFEVSGDVRFAGRQTDLILNSREEHVGRIIIECKFHEPSSWSRVGVAEVEDFAARVLRLRNAGNANLGYLVTNTDFTADAKGALLGRPEQQFVLLRTIQELLRKLVDFTPYLARQVRAYEEGEAFAAYEELNGIQSNTRANVPLLPTLQKFATSAEDGVVAILLGDYGSGKTTTAQRLAYLLAKQALAEGYAARIPCMIPLKYFSLTGTAPALILEFLSRDVGIRGITYDAFHEMNRAGLLLLILDGFDEMAKRVTRQVREESFRTLGDLLTPKGKMIITGRPGYFPAEHDFLNAIEMVRSPSSTTTMRRLLQQRRSSGAANILLVGVSSLDAQQIKSFLQKRLSRRRATKQQSVLQIIARINSMYNLAELARRPILLEMIAETLGQQRRRELRNVAQLYDAYTSLWLEIDAAKGQFRTLISAHLRLEFAMHLAWQMYESGTERLHFAQLGEIVAAHFELDEPEDVDHFSSDVRTCSFLHRDEKGFYSFSHRSFFEYFVAKFLIRANNGSTSVGRGKFSTDYTISDLSERLPNVFNFLSPLLGYPFDPGFWQPVVEAIQGQTNLLDLVGESEDTWYLIASDLAAGKAPLDSLGDFEFQVRETYKALVKVAKTHRSGSGVGSSLKAIVHLVKRQEAVLGNT